MGGFGGTGWLIQVICEIETLPPKISWLYPNILVDFFVWNPITKKAGT